MNLAQSTLRNKEKTDSINDKEMSKTFDMPNKI